MRSRSGYWLPLPPRTFGRSLLAASLSVLLALAPEICCRAGQPVLLDAQGDPLPSGALARLGTTRFRTAGLIYTCAFSPDGKLVAAGSVDPAVCLLDANSGRVLSELRAHSYDVTVVTFSKDGSLLATGDDGGTICLWRVKDRRLVRKIKPCFGGITCAVFTPDGADLVFGCGQDGRIRILNIAKGDVRSIGGHQYPVNAVAVTSDGRTIVGGGNDNTIRFWERDSGKQIDVLRGHSMLVSRVAISPDGKTLLSASNDGTAILWDMATRKQRRRLVMRSGAGGAFEEIRSAGFSPDGAMAALGGACGNVSLWDVQTGKNLRFIHGHESVTYTKRHLGGIRDVSFSPDGQTLLWGTDNRLRQWDVRTWHEKDATPLHGGAVRLVAVSPDGRKLVTGSDDLDHRFLEWDSHSGRLPRPLPVKLDHTPFLDGCAVSADLKLMVAIEDTSIKLLSTANGAEVRRLQARDVLHPVFSADGHFLYGAGKLQASDLLIWDLSSGRTNVRSTGHEGQNVVCKLAVSPDGRFVACGGKDRKITLYEAASEKATITFECPDMEYDTPLVFSPDSHLLAAAAEDAVVRIWDVRSRRAHAPWPAQRRHVNAIAFSPDCTLLATASDDGDVRIHEAATGRERRRFSGHRGPVGAIAFTPDGQSLVSGSDDTTALVWDVSDLRAPPMKLERDRLERLWEEMSDANIVLAYRAVFDLARSPEQSVPFLRQRVRPAERISAAHLETLISDLDSDTFRKRQAAQRQLIEIGQGAEPAVRKALGSSPGPELRGRLEEILRRIQPENSDDIRRLGRVVDALEHAATPEARQILQRLADGAPGVPLTRQAKAAIERLAAP